MLRQDQSSSMQKHLWDEPKRQWCPPSHIVVIKINKEIKTCLDKYSAAGLSNLTCSFCPEQVIQERQNHIKALGLRVAGRCRCDPADSSAPHVASPQTGSSSHRATVRAGSQGRCFSQLLTFSPAHPPGCALGRCGAIASWNVPPVIGSSLPGPPSLHIEHDTLWWEISLWPVLDISVLSTLFSP